MLLLPRASRVVAVAMAAPELTSRTKRLRKKLCQDIQLICCCVPLCEVAVVPLREVWFSPNISCSSLHDPLCIHSHMAKCRADREENEKTSANYGPFPCIIESVQSSVSASHSPSLACAWVRTSNHVEGGVDDGILE